MEERLSTSQPPRVPPPRQRALTRADIAGEFEIITGRRVVLVNRSGPEGTFYDFRALTEVVLRPVGFEPDVSLYPYVLVISDEAWWNLYFHTPGGPDAVDQGELASLGARWWPAGALWVEGR